MFTMLERYGKAHYDEFASESRRRVVLLLPMGPNSVNLHGLRELGEVIEFVQMPPVPSGELVPRWINRSRGMVGGGAAKQ
tara:strand:- start:786 stop:1025 length:240 start_codon:yes stop_codon:yes gene_type:complete